MTGKLWSRGGVEWQEHILILLKRKYGPEFVEIPDIHRGDCGLEGFSRNGYAYHRYLTFFRNIFFGYHPIYKHIFQTYSNAYNCCKK